MKELIKKVEHFHKTFGHPVSNEPRLIKFERSVLRADLMNEENQEYDEACDDSNIVEVADALGDMLYILLGTIIEHGMQDKILDIFNEIHDSNMSKLGEDGKPILREDGKILKGKNYFKPNIKKFFK